MGSRNLSRGGPWSILLRPTSRLRSYRRRRAVPFSHLFPPMPVREGPVENILACFSIRRLNAVPEEGFGDGKMRVEVGRLRPFLSEHCLGTRSGRNRGLGRFDAPAQVAEPSLRVPLV